VTKSETGILLGSCEHAVDDKHRVAIPAMWRSRLSGSHELYVFPDPTDCLLVYPSSEIEELMTASRRISIGEYKRRDALRAFASRGHVTTIDKQGRITLTDELMEYAGITRSAVLVGQCSKIEIWSPDRWKKKDQDSTQSFGEIAQLLGL